MSKTLSESKNSAEMVRRIREAGVRARAEAEARRAMNELPHAPREIGGAGGPEPTRYGDWERKGVATDF